MEIRAASLAMAHRGILRERSRETIFLSTFLQKGAQRILLVSGKMEKIPESASLMAINGLFRPNYTLELYIFEGASSVLLVSTLE